MVQTYLLDTGYLSTAREPAGSPSADEQVNNGSAVAIDIQDIKLTQGSNVERSPHTGELSSTPANLVSVENRVYDVTIRCDRTEASEREVLRHLAGVSGSSTYPGADRTEGVKLIYANGSSARQQSLIEVLGRLGTNFHGNEINTLFSALVGYVSQVVVDESGDGSHFKVQLKFVETV